MLVLMVSCIAGDMEQLVVEQGTVLLPTSTLVATTTYGYVFGHTLAMHQGIHVHAIYWIYTAFDQPVAALAHGTVVKHE